MNTEKIFSLTGLTITADQLELLFKYERLLVEWNKKINLVSRKPNVDVFLSHILPSILYMRVLDFNNKAILDVGTGGGLPGVPLAVCSKNSNFVLIDSIQKKITALSDICKKMDIKNVLPVVGRVENFKSKKFNFVVARGVATIKTLVKYSLPLSTDKKFLLSLKGGDLEKEKDEALSSFSYIKIKEMPVNDLLGNESLWADKKFILVERK